MYLTAAFQVVNLQHSEVQDRVMLTGRHMVRDVSCKNCNSKLGWMYEFATEESQRYKEGRIILERALVRESEGFEHIPSDNSWGRLCCHCNAQRVHSKTFPLCMDSEPFVIRVTPNTWHQKLVVKSRSGGCLLICDFTPWWVITMLLLQLFELPAACVYTQQPVIFVKCVGVMGCWLLWGENSLLLSQIAM